MSARRLPADASQLAPDRPAEVAYIVDDCEAKALVTTGDLEVAAPDRAIAGSVLITGGAGEDDESFETALRAQSPAALVDPAPGTMMLYTSGTTGRPKGVHRNARATTVTTLNLGGYNEDGGDVHLCTGPLYHAAPLAFSLTIPLMFGATVVLMEHWDAQETLRLLAEHGVTHTHMVANDVPPLARVARKRCRDGSDVSSLRYVLHGAAVPECR